MLLKTSSGSDEFCRYIIYLNFGLEINNIYIYIHTRTYIYSGGGEGLFFVGA